MASNNSIQLVRLLRSESRPHSYVEVRTNASGQLIESLFKLHSSLLKSRIHLCICKGVQREERLMWLYFLFVIIHQEDKSWGILTHASILAYFCWFSVLTVLIGRGRTLCVSMHVYLKQIQFKKWDQIGQEDEKVRRIQNICLNVGKEKSAALQLKARK